MNRHAPAANSRSCTSTFADCRHYDYCMQAIRSIHDGLQFGMATLNADRDGSQSHLDKEFFLKLHPSVNIQSLKNTAAPTSKCFVTIAPSGPNIEIRRFPKAV